MIQGIDLKDMKDTLSRDSSARFFVVAQKAQKYVRFENIQDCKSLAPSKELAHELKIDNITNEEYERRYKKELFRPISQSLIDYFYALSNSIEVYIVMDGPDRLLLMDVISKSAR